MKLLCLSILFISFAGIALINLSVYKQKLKVLDGLISFFKLYVNEISFNKADYYTIIETNKSRFCPKVCEILFNHNTISQYPTLLNENEAYEVYLLLSSLGKHDLDGEISVANNALIKLDNLYKSNLSLYNTKGVLKSKLIFVIGLILIIILM